MIVQGTREAGTGKELGWIAVVLGGCPRYHLFEGDSKLVWAERPAFPNLLAKRYRPVPGFKGIRLLPPRLLRRQRWAAIPIASPNHRTDDIRRESRPSLSPLPEGVRQRPFCTPVSFP